MGMTHQQLYVIGSRWLKRPCSQRGPYCHVALIEVGSYAANPGEIADVWGYRYDRVLPGSVLIEVKVTRANFQADSKKPHRNGGRLGVGTYRYYLCPQGVIHLNDLPPGWGLLWVNSRGHVQVKARHVGCMMWSNVMGTQLAPAWAHPADERREKLYLARSLSRIGDPAKAMDLMRACDRQQRRIQELEQQLRESKKSIDTLRWQLQQYEPEPVDW